MMFFNSFNRGVFYTLIILLLSRTALAGDLILSTLQFRATVGTMPSSAAYVSIINHGKIADQLLGVTSKLARKTELHAVEMSNGVMTMREVEGGIYIPAGETVRLAPGGYHVMLMGLNAPLEAGSMFEITLFFDRAGKKTIKGMAMLPSSLVLDEPAKMNINKHKTN